MRRLVAVTEAAGNAATVPDATAAAADASVVAGASAPAAAVSVATVALDAKNAAEDLCYYQRSAPG